MGLYHSDAILMFYVGSIRPIQLIRVSLSNQTQYCQFDEGF